MKRRMVGVRLTHCWTLRSRSNLTGGTKPRRLAGARKSVTMPEQIIRHVLRPASWFVGAGVALAILAVAACSGSRPTLVNINTPTAERSAAAPIVSPSTSPSVSTATPESAATATAPVTSVPPTEAATPPLVQQTTPVSQLPILVVLLGTGAASYYQQFAGPADIGIIPAQRLNYFNNEAALIPTKTIAAGIESWEAGQPLLDSLQGRASYVAYDIEHWPQTPAGEQQNIVATVQNMSQVLHSRGIKFILVPDRQFDQQYMPQFAPFADIIVLQGQRIQSDTQNFHDQLQPLIATAKSANPNVKVFASVGTNNGATSASMQAALHTVLGSIDGISVFSMGDQASLNTLEQFVSDIRK